MPEAPSVEEVPARVVLEMPSAPGGSEDVLACPDDADTDRSLPRHTGFDVQVDTEQGN